MSQHQSFKKGLSNVIKKRNVLKRFERISILKSKGLWGQVNNFKVTGLPKTKVNN